MGGLSSRRDLADRRVAGRSALSNEHVIENFDDARGIPVLEAIDAHRGAARIGAVETLHPLSCALEELGIARHHHHSVHARNRLEANYPLAAAILAGLEHPLELVDHGFRRRRLERVDAD